MTRYLALIWVFIKKSLQQQMAFRSDFLIKLLHIFLGLAGGIGAIAVLFSQKQTLNGWSFAQTLAVLGVFLLLQSLKSLFIEPSLAMLGGLDGELWSGAFDFTLLKPVPVQYHISVRNWVPWTLLDLIVSIAVLGTALLQLNSRIGLLNVLLFAATLLISLLMVYSILLLLNSAGFWYLGTPLEWIFNSFFQMGRYPVGIYPGVIRFLLTWIIPVGFIVTVPVEVLTSGVKPVHLIGGLGLAFGLFTAGTLLLRAGIRRYSGASG
jgi:ABC-2 type transport system permease protein